MPTFLHLAFFLIFLQQYGVHFLSQNVVVDNDFQAAKSNGHFQSSPRKCLESIQYSQSLFPFWNYLLPLLPRQISRYFLFLLLPPSFSGSFNGSFSSSWLLGVGILQNAGLASYLPSIDDHMQFVDFKYNV